MNNIVKKLKKDTNEVLDVTYRFKDIFGKEVVIVFNESLTGSSIISDFIVRSLDKINKSNYKGNIIGAICNNIDNFKYKKIYNYNIK